jgi:nitrite reductase/ring-hydroxylating ferredoxin subunit
MRRWFLYRKDNGFIITERPYSKDDRFQMDKDRADYEKNLKCILGVGEFDSRNGQLMRCEPAVSELKFYPYRKNFLRSKK